MKSWGDHWARFIGTALLCVPWSSAAASELSDAADALRPGEWALLETEGIGEALNNTGGASGFVFGYTEDIKWDSEGRQLLYVGSDHSQTEGARFLRYIEATNAWQEIPRESWMAVSKGSAIHGYDHMAIDVESRSFWFRPFSNQTMYRYDLEAMSWSAEPDNTLLEYNNCCAGIEHFPELGGLVWATMETGNGNLGVSFLAPGDGAWSRLGPYDTYPVGELHNFAEYNPVHGVMVVGGGNSPGADQIYVVDSNGDVGELAAAPVELGVQSSIFTVDPGTGDFLVFASNTEFYVYDVIADDWTLQEGTPPIFTGEVNDPPVHGLVATPLSTFNINLFVDCHNTGCSVHLYRHSNNPAPDPKDPPGGDESGGDESTGGDENTAGNETAGDSNTSTASGPAEDDASEDDPPEDPTTGSAETADATDDTNTGCGCRTSRPAAPGWACLPLLVLWRRRSERGSS